VAILVREATKKDVGAIARVHVETWREAYKDVFPRDALARMSVDEREAMWRKTMGDPMPGTDRVALVAVDGQDVIGFATAGREQNEDAFLRGEVFTLYVHPLHQRRGAGRALLADALRRLRRAQLLPAIVWVLERNAQARAFYEHLGGAPARRRQERVLGTVVDEVGYAFFSL
jgi:ribosomal protein S18 acetylase RimI-like enzyme